MKGNLLPITWKCFFVLDELERSDGCFFINSSFSELGMWFQLCIKMKQFTYHLGFIRINLIIKMGVACPSPSWFSRFTTENPTSCEVFPFDAKKKLWQLRFATHNNRSFVTLHWTIRRAGVVIASLTVIFDCLLEVQIMRMRTLWYQHQNAPKITNKEDYSYYIWKNVYNIIIY